MKTIRLVALVLWVVLLSATAFAQGVGGTLTGTVEDASRAIIPGVEIKATNTQTGIVTAALTNEAGAYVIPGLLPGVYKLTAQLPGFSTSDFRQDRVEHKRYETFQLHFAGGGSGDDVDVIVDATTLLSANSATIGEVLPASRVAELPMVGGDVLDLMAIMAGVRVSAFGGTFTTFAGISAEYVNTTVNGLSVQDGRGGIFGSLGVNTTTVINPDLVGEIRLILTPSMRNSDAATDRFRSRRGREQTGTPAPLCGMFETTLWMRDPGVTTMPLRSRCGTGSTATSTR